MRKTKKQKLLADLRRKINLVEKTIEIQKPISLNVPLDVKKETPIKYSFSQANKTHENESLKIDYPQIAKDMRKTLLFSAIIIGVLTVLKLVLK